MKAWQMFLSTDHDFKIKVCGEFRVVLQSPDEIKHNSSIGAATKNLLNLTKTSFRAEQSDGLMKTEGWKRKSMGRNRYSAVPGHQSSTTHDRSTSGRHFKTEINLSLISWYFKKLFQVYNCGEFKVGNLLVWTARRPPQTFNLILLDLLQSSWIHLLHTSHYSCSSTALITCQRPKHEITTGLQLKKWISVYAMVRCPQQCCSYWHLGPPLVNSRCPIWHLTPPEVPGSIRVNTAWSSDPVQCLNIRSGIPNGWQTLLQWNESHARDKLPDHHSQVG